MYEAGPTGFGLARFLRERQLRCLVGAPSKMQRPSGDRVKTDSRDALLLARLLRLGEIVEVTVPSVAQEAARDQVRAREDVRGDLMRARHRTSKLLLRQGIVYSGETAWTIVAGHLCSPCRSVVSGRSLLKTGPSAAVPRSAGVRSPAGRGLAGTLRACSLSRLRPSARIRS